MTEKRFENLLGDEYELFKLAAPHYDELQSSVGKIVKEEFSNKSIGTIKVLEIGFGAGETSRVILESDSRVILTGIDNELLMLPKAKRTLASIDATRFTLQIKDALEFLKNSPPTSFDVIASAWVIHNFILEYRLKVIKEIYRVLKPDGLFINADKIEKTDRAQHEKNLIWQISKFDIFEEIGKPELKKEWTDHYIEDSKPGRALIEEDFQKIAASIGFKSFKILNRWHDDATALIIK